MCSSRSQRRRSARSFSSSSISRAQSHRGCPITSSWEASAAVPRWLRCSWLSALAGASLHCWTVNKPLRHTPLMSFIWLQPRLARRHFFVCHWFVRRTRHTCPLALADWSQILILVVSQKDISQWEQRVQAWSVRSPQVWLGSTFHYVHTCQLLWYSVAPR